MTGIFRSVNRDAKITVEGEYEFIQGIGWILRRWRIGSEYRESKTAGNWHAIHGNQRKDIGSLKLVRDNMQETVHSDPFSFWSD